MLGSSLQALRMSDRESSFQALLSKRLPSENTDSTWRCFSVLAWNFRARLAARAANPVTQVTSVAKVVSSNRFDSLKLIRFRGHPILLESGGHDAEIKNALPAGVPAQDCRTG